MLNLEYTFRTYQRYFVIFGAFLLNFTIGNLYTYNNMAPYLVKFMQNKSYSGQSVTEGNAVWIFGMGIFGIGSSITLGDFFVKRIGPSMTALFAGWLMSITVLMMTYTLYTYLSVVVLTYGFLNGVGSGIVYGVALSTGCKWFPNRKGTASGVIVAGFGLSAFLIDYLQSMFVIYPLDIDTFNKLPTSYLLLGCIFLLLQFIGAILLRNPEMEEGNSMTKTNVSDILGLKEEEHDVCVNIMPHNLIMELDFWILWFTYSLLSASFALIISLHKEFGLLLKISDLKPYYILSMASSMGSLCNCLGRIFWGYVIDKVRYKIVMLILTISLTILLATFYLPVWIYGTNNGDNKGLLAIYFIWVMLLYFVPSGMFAIFPFTCFRLFGQKHFVANYGMLFTAFSLGGLITSCITTYIWYGDPKTPQLHLWAFISGSVMAALAALVTLVYRGRSLIRHSGYI